jgi:hypothetical protein
MEPLVRQGAAAQPGKGRLIVVVILAVVVLGALGYLALELRRPPVTVVAPTGPAAEPPASDRPGATPDRTPAPPRAAPVSRPAPRPATADRSVPDGGARRLAPLTRAHVRLAQARLHRAADSCMTEALKRNPGLGVRAHLRYTLVIANGEGRAANPHLEHSEVGDPAAERCIMDRIRETRWQVDAPDGSLAVGESFNFKHLRQIHVIE